jgi:hypothetical protein
MSTRFTKSKSDGVSIDTGTEGNNIPDDIQIASCAIEDVDRALFNLFNKDIALFYNIDGTQKRIPVIFATGERFALLRRKKALRDKSGVLILPLISITRNAISQTTSLSHSQNQPIVIKKRLSESDPQYQNLINRESIKNQDNVSSEAHRTSTTTGSLGGTVATRRLESKKPFGIGENIFEIITIPPPKFFTATYEVTIWTQYTQQMNNVITSIMSGYHDYNGRTYRIETDKGYWFVAKFDDGISYDSNYEDFSDEERIVRYSFSVTVPGYTVTPEYPGSQNQIRKFVSAPEISFETIESNSFIHNEAGGSPISGDPSDFILSDMSDELSEIPGGAMGTNPSSQNDLHANIARPGSTKAGSDARNFTKGKKISLNNNESVLIGGHERGSTGAVYVTKQINPITGKSEPVALKVKSYNKKRGETVLRPGLIKGLDKL